MNTNDITPVPKRSRTSSKKAPTKAVLSKTKKVGTPIKKPRLSKSKKPKPTTPSKSERDTELTDFDIVMNRPITIGSLVRVIYGDLPVETTLKLSKKRSRRSV